MQKQVFVPWKGTRCFNLVAEPRLLLAFATLLIAVVAGVWFGGDDGTSSSDNIGQRTGRQQEPQHVSFEVEHQTTFTTILAKSTTMTATQMYDRSPIAADLTMTTNPGVHLKPLGSSPNLNVDDQGADGLETLSLFLSSIQH